MAKRVPEGPPPAPVVQKLRVQYAKRGRLRYTSTRDFQRALERAVRRAGLPVAFSAGFHPHPRISYANAATTGTASEAEYFEISLTQECDPQQVAGTLDAALPPGLDVVRAVPAAPGALADRLEASVWRVDVPEPSRPGLREATEAFLAAESVEVTRMTKSGPRTFDTRAAVLSWQVAPDASTMTVLCRNTTPTVRPDDLLTALGLAGGYHPATRPTVTRLAQGPVLQEPAGASVGDPLAQPAS